MPENCEFSLKSLGEGFWSIEESFVRSYLLLGKDEGLLIDCGYSRSGFDDAVRQITALPIRLVLTHADHDHTGSFDFYEPFMMHPDEISYAKLQGMKWNIPFLPVRDGDTIDVAGRSLEVFHLPGHTPGSIVLFDAKQGHLFSGDSISANPLYMFGEGRDLALFAKNLRTLNNHVGTQVQQIWPSHGDLPLDPNYLPETIECAEALLAGILPAQTLGTDAPYSLYQHKRAQIFFKR